MKKARAKSGTGMTIGAVLVVASIALGWWQYQVGIERGFAALQKTYEASQTTADPQTISAPADHAIYAILAGAGGVLVGLVIFIRSALGEKGA